MLKCPIPGENSIPRVIRMERMENQKGNVNWSSPPLEQAHRYSIIWTWTCMMVIRYYGKPVCMVMIKKVGWRRVSEKCFHVLVLISPLLSLSFTFSPRLFCQLINQFRSEKTLWLSSNRNGTQHPPLADFFWLLWKVSCCVCIYVCKCELPLSVTLSWVWHNKNNVSSNIIFSLVSQLSACVINSGYECWCHVVCVYEWVKQVHFLFMIASNPLAHSQLQVHVRSAPLHSN